ncbi:hypothetical protein llap_3636 [Limosa lapponica baueri]|uniref:Uncharacterized protein n=1 Tax=Limosa lapponica baueri TaxID=1758121 RepID=A0A2I0UJ35_LIMLA|nr:hypothetical protein llap_3636 [Limosa lapponica baueri]
MTKETKRLSPPLPALLVEDDQSKELYECVHEIESTPYETYELLNHRYWFSLDFSTGFDNRSGYELSYEGRITEIVFLQYVFQEEKKQQNMSKEQRMQKEEAIILSPQISPSYSGQQGMAEDGAFAGEVVFFAHSTVTVLEALLNGGILSNEATMKLELKPLN